MPWARSTWRSTAPTSGPFAGLKTAFLLDPDGIRIEFVEVAYWLDEERRAGIARYWAER